ncbi:hypothetical protein BH11PSE3_BH11PSE3_22170 [soil metagenome]
MAWMRTVLAIAAMALTSACAVSRSEITVAPPVSTQPAGGVAVVVAPIDARQFEVAPAAPSIPSLKEPAQITDKQITSRAVARKRNGYGMALGDVLLAPPQTVASLVGTAVTAGLRDSGYRVLEPSDPEYASAPKVNMKIVQFWTWVQPGFAQIRLDSVTQLVLDGNLPALFAPVTVSVNDNKGYGAIFESDWAPFIAGTLTKVREQVRTALAPRIAAAPRQD